jgi:predicted RND superfamily exporter protein
MKKINWPLVELIMTTIIYFSLLIFSKNRLHIVIGFLFGCMIFLGIYKSVVVQQLLNEKKKQDKSDEKE